MRVGMVMVIIVNAAGPTAAPPMALKSLFHPVRVILEYAQVHNDRQFGVIRNLPIVLNKKRSDYLFHDRQLLFPRCCTRSTSTP
ncbi:hypothetical protein D3C81_2148940 [compost metagenome]